MNELLMAWNNGTVLAKALTILYITAPTIILLTVAYVERRWDNGKSAN